MAVFAFSEPQRLLNRRTSSKSLVRRIFDATIEARMAQAQRMVEEHTALNERYNKPNKDAYSEMVVGKNGVNVWPF